jgi:hypothetical protein
MVWDVSFSCDICGKKKGEANHWWMVMLGDVPCWEADQPNHRFTLFPWNAAESQNPDMYHLCGEGCAMQAMQRFMTSKEIVSFSEKTAGVAHPSKKRANGSVRSDVVRFAKP